MSDFSVPSTSVSPVSLLAQPATASQKANSPAGLRHAAGEFEAILLGQWLQGAEDSFGSVPGSDDEQDAGSEQMKQFAVQALGKSFSAAGGIGLANMVTKALAQNNASRAAEVSVPTDSPTKTE